MHHNENCIFYIEIDGTAKLYLTHGCQIIYLFWKFHFNTGNIPEDPIFSLAIFFYLKNFFGEIFNFFKKLNTINVKAAQVPSGVIRCPWILNVGHEGSQERIVGLLPKLFMARVNQQRPPLVPSPFLMSPWGGQIKAQKC